MLRKTAKGAAVVLVETGLAALGVPPAILILTGAMLFVFVYWQSLRPILAKRRRTRPVLFILLAGFVGFLIFGAAAWTWRGNAVSVSDDFPLDVQVKGARFDPPDVELDVDVLNRLDKQLVAYYCPVIDKPSEPRQIFAFDDPSVLTLTNGLQANIPSRSVVSGTIRFAGLFGVNPSEANTLTFRADTRIMLVVYERITDRVDIFPKSSLMTPPRIGVTEADAIMQDCLRQVKRS